MYLWYLIVRPQCISNATTVYPLLASCLMDNSLAGTRDAPGLAMSRRRFKDVETIFEKSPGRGDKNLSDTF